MIVLRVGKENLEKGSNLLSKILRQCQPDLEQNQSIDIAIQTAKSIWDTIQSCDLNAPSIDDRLLLPIDDARRLNPDWWRLKHIGRTGSIFRCNTCNRIQGISVKGVCTRHRCPGTVVEIPSNNLELNHYRYLYETNFPGSFRVEEHTAQLDKEEAREYQKDFREGKISVLSCSTTFELGVDLGDLDTIFLRNVPPEAFNYAQRVGRSGRRSGFPGFAVTYCKRSPHDLYHFSDPQQMLSGNVRPPVLAIRNEKIVLRPSYGTQSCTFFFKADSARFDNVKSLVEDFYSPKGNSEFSTFLNQHRTQLELIMSSIVPEDLWSEIGILNGSWIDKLSGNNSRFELAEAEVVHDYISVRKLEDQSTRFERL